MNEQEFLEIWKASAAGDPVELEYRLYHDEDGYPLFCSMEDLPGLYINIDESTYLDLPKNIRVIDGKIVETLICWTKKLTPGKQGKPCDPWDVCVIVDTDQPHTAWKFKHQELVHDYKS